MILQIDAFVDYDVGALGNPAGVCLLDDKFYAKEEMQSIAASYNWSETCFVVKHNGQDAQMKHIKSIWPHHPIFTQENQSRINDNAFFIRWFSPKDEAPLCGHATLAACYAIFKGYAQDGGYDKIQVIFSDGFINASNNKDTDIISIAMPTKNFTKCDIMPEQYLGIAAEDVIDVMSDGVVCFFVVKNDDIVAHCVPNHNAILKTSLRAMAVTSASSAQGVDFASRYFAPSVGIYEDPVCGSLHCRLAKYWSHKLGKVDMIAKQLSQRGGILHVRYENEYVILGGKCSLIKEFQ